MKNKLSTIHDLRFTGVKPICSKRCGLTVLVIFLIALIVTGSLFWIIHFKGLHTRRVYLNSLHDFIKNTEFCTGDLIFRRGSSFESLMVLSVDRESQYSHVGVVVVEGEVAYVVHTEPGDKGSGNEAVRKENVDYFLAPDKATQYALFRLSNHDQLNIDKLTHWLDSIYAFAVPFDYRFDDADSTRLYCSELVWKGYEAAGISLLLEKNASLVLFGTKLSVILPSALLGQQSFFKVASYPCIRVKTN